MVYGDEIAKMLIKNEYKPTRTRDLNVQEENVDEFNEGNFVLLLVARCNCESESVILDSIILGISCIFIIWDL